MKNKKYLLLILMVLCLAAMLAGCNIVGNLIENGELINSNVGYNFKNAKITLVNDFFTYNGEEIQPEISKVEIGIAVVPKENYTISFENNINAGEATLTVTASGVYTGSQSIAFTISPKSLGTVSATMTTDYVYIGNPVETDISNIKSDGVLLTQNDYELTYSNNINIGDNAEITVSGKGNYKGNVTFTYTIKPLNLADVEIVLKQNEYTYTGEPIEPEVLKILINGKSVNINGEDFSISFTDNTDIGVNARLTIIGKSENCIGEKFKLFTITEMQIYSISFSDVEGEQFSAIYGQGGSKIFKPSDPDIIDKEGQTINWYTVENYSIENRFFFDFMPMEDKILYGRWEIEQRKTFFSYANAIPDTNLDSREELIAYMEYVFFNQIESAEEQLEYYEITYPYTSIQDELDYAWTNMTYPATTGFTRNTLDNKFKLYVSSTSQNVFEPTLSAETTCVQYNSFNYMPEPNSRGEAFNAFYIESLTDSYKVSTSNQLFFVLEHGLKPSPIQGTKAELIYEKAKEVLRVIIDDGMTDYEKSQAIYQWISREITYDYDVAFQTQEWVNYNDFYLEGVFLDKVAVCDGISKAYVVLCQMEGIPCVRVTGMYNEEEKEPSGHAWNKVKIENQWYVVDATWGNTGINKTNEFLNMQHFLISDTDKSNSGCESNTYNYMGITAIGINEYYENNVFSYDDVIYDYIIDNQEELCILLKYCDAKGVITDYTINFKVVFDYGSKIEDELRNAWVVAHGVGNLPTYIKSALDSQIITLIFK